MAYSVLPKPIRLDKDNEIGKNERKSTAEHIIKTVSVRFLQKANTYWNDLDLELKKTEIAETCKTALSQPILGQNRITEDDAFIIT